MEVPDPRANDTSDGSQNSPIVAVSYLAAALINVLFIKGLAVHLPIALFGAVVTVLSPMLALTFVALTRQALAASDASARRGKGFTATFPPQADRFVTRMIAGGIVLAAICYLATPLSDMLHFPARTFSAAMPLLAVTTLLNAMASGTLLGSGRDHAFAGLVILEPLLRIVLALIFVGAKMGSFAPILAMLMSTTTSLVICRSRLPAQLEPDPPKTAREKMIRNRLPLHPFRGIGSQLALTGFGLLVFLDVPLVRILLSPDESGLYAGIATASRFLLLMPFPLALLLAARVRSRRNQRLSEHGELFRVLGLLLIPAGFSLLVVNAFSPRLLGLFLDYNKFGGGWVDYPRYALAAALFGAALLTLFYGISAGRVSLAVLPLAAAAVEVVLLAESGNSVENCVTVIQAMALLFLVVLGVVVLVPALWARRP